MNKYRSAREFCFQFFFHTQLPVLESVNTDYLEKEKLEKAIAEFKESTNTIFDTDLNDFSFRLISTTVQNSKELESKITSHLKNWKLERISKIDKTILMMAINEIIFLDISPSIAINEAVELSKKFGSKDSSKFINGILDKIAKS